MALRLDATSSQYLAITSGALDNSGSFTVCGWFRRLSGTNRHVFNIMGGTRDWQHMDVVFVDSSGNWRIEAIVSYNVYSATAGACAVDTDYFIALVRDGSSSLKLYVDGALECEVTDDVGGRPSSTWMQLGAYYDGGASGFSDARFSGWKAWSRALSQVELDGEALSKLPKSHDSLYAYWPFAPGASRPLDYSGNGHDWTENASPTDESDPPVAWGTPMAAVGVESAAVASDTFIVGLHRIEHGLVPLTAAGLGGVLQE